MLVSSGRVTVLEGTVTAAPRSVVLGPRCDPRGHLRDGRIVEIRTIERHARPTDAGRSHQLLNEIAIGRITRDHILQVWLLTRGNVHECLVSACGGQIQCTRWNGS